MQMKMLVFILLIAKIAYCASQEDADLSSIESRLLDAELKIDQALMSIQAKKLGIPVKRDWFRLPGFDCGNGQLSDGGVTIYFPQSLDATYPIVSFLHGSGGGHFDGLCADIAGLGMVVVAVDGGVCGDWSNQQVHAVLGSAQHKDLHPALSHVDFTSVGVIGHSEGGAYTQGTAAYHKEMPVKAAVMSHGGGTNSAKDLPKDLPVYYATGSKDPRRHRLYPAFDIAPSRPSIFANVAGATHMAPARSGPQNIFMAHFLGCYLIPRPESCNMVFGEEDGTLCHGGAHMADCIIRLPEDEDDDYFDYADPVPAPVWDEPGEFEVDQDYYTLPGFDCGDGTVGDGGILIYFPANPDTRPGMTYPIASFLHGSGGGRFDGLCRGIASFGIVVVAVTQGTCGEWSVQQMHAVTGSQQNTQLHMVLPYVDFSSIGVIGHSEGGAYTMESATKANQFPIKAGVFSHGGSSNAAPHIPSNLPVFFVSGTADPRRRRLYWAYQATTSVPRIFATIEGGNHMYPAHGSPMNEMMAHFLACYLLPRKDSCEVIYGDGSDSLCKKNPMGDCDIIKETDSEEFSDPVPAPVWDEPGEFAVAQDYYTLPGFDCGDGTVGNGGILIYFPAHPDTRPGMKYPVASFLHGSGGGRFDGLCRGIASFGIVVVAVTQGTCGEWSVQQMHAVTGSQQNTQLHEVLPYVDFSSIGVIGHSEGGAYTMESATKANQFPIKAGVFSHGGSSNAAPSIPSNLPVFFVSGTADPRRRRLYWAYQATTSIPRIFATIEGGKHMYPAHGSPMNEMMAHFLACYLLPRKESCEIIYGDGQDSLCKKNSMGDCDIIKDSNSDSNIIVEKNKEYITV